MNNLFSGIDAEAKYSEVWGLSCPVFVLVQSHSHTVLPRNTTVLKKELFLWTPEQKVSHAQ